MAAQGFEVPDISVEQPATVGLADGGSRAFGTVAAGSTADMEFTIRNSGTVNLTGLGITLDGFDASMFSIVTPPTAPVVPGGSTTFTLRFAPTNGGGHTAALHIASNDFDENPYDITLSDTAAPSANAELSALTLSAGTLAPAFGSATTGYTATVPYLTTSLTLTPTKRQSGATIMVNGVTVASGSASAALPLAVGGNVISTVVTAVDGSTTQTYTVTVTRAGLGLAEVDLDYDPRASATVNTAVLQPDGKLLVGGQFGSFQPSGGSVVTRANLARLNRDGTVDTAFNPAADGAVHSLRLLADGKVLVGGAFSNLGGALRQGLARLNADGTADGSFGNPALNAATYAISAQADGKLLIAGLFTQVGTVTRNYVARLTPDGVLDAGYDPNANNKVWCLLPLADGKALIAGEFTQVGGLVRSYLARLNADGTLDVGFNAALNGSVFSLMQQADGKIVLGGDFTSVFGQTRNRAARLNVDGTLDTGFHPNANGTVASLLAQADGKMLLAGSFTTLQPNGAASATTRNRLARLNADGTLDVSFDPSANNTVRSLAMQADGKIIAGGDFTGMGATTRSFLTRLGNTAASESLTVPSSSRLEWLRGGSAPEAVSVIFEASIDAGVSYQFVGEGIRIAGGWEYLPALGTLPASGQIRALARCTSGAGSSSSGLMRVVTSFSGFAVPDIALEQPESSGLADGGSVAFGSVAVDSTADRVFTIRNEGTVDLTGLAITLDGFDAEMFSFIVPPTAPVLPGGSTTFTVRFAPTNGGGHVAALHIASNDFDETPFDIALSDVAAPSANADLMNLAISSGTLSPAFALNTTSYTASVVYGTTSLTVTPTKRHPGASIQVNGVTVASSVASAALPLIVGDNVISTVVTAADGSTIKTYTITVTRAAILPGDVERGFDPRPSSTVANAVPQADGKILVGGIFTSFLPNGGATVARNYLARLNTDGTVDTGFNPSPNYFAGAIAPQADGQIYVGGSFGTIGGQAYGGLVRLNADGTVDSSFINPALNAPADSIAIQADGKVIICGNFTTVGGVVRSYIARLNRNGTLDTTFRPILNSFCASAKVQVDGKILVAGGFSTVNGVTRQGLARLNTDGTLDTIFNAKITGSVSLSALQPDGKMLLAGDFTKVMNVNRNRVARLNADGTLDMDFDPNVNGRVDNLVVQANGKIIISGNFTTVQPNGAASATTRNRIAKLNVDGTLETSFDPKPNDTVFSLALLADGQVLVGGRFTSIGIGAAARSYLVKLGNEAVSQTLTLTGATRLEWLRGGSLPEAAAVTFQATTDAGVSYSTLGQGTRIAGGWEYLPAAGTLPVSGDIRAVAQSVAGFNSGSTGLTSAALTFSGFTAPEIAVEQPVNTGLVDGGSFAFGSVSAGFSEDRQFTIRNTGTADLTGLSITLDGPDAAMFTIPSPPMSPVLAGDSTTFILRFSPTNGGGHTAALHIASNDFDEASFDLALTDTSATSANANLTDLKMFESDISPVFASDTTAYSAAVTNAMTEATLLLTRQQNGSTLKVGGTTQNFHAVFSNAGTAWAVGAAGRIYKTTSNGFDWSAQVTGTTQALNSVHFTTVNLGWVVGAGGTILKTTNGGTSWRPQTSGTAVALEAVFFSDANTGWIVGAGGLILKTSNGGTNWTPQVSGSTQTLNDLRFSDASIGWVVGSGGTILKTTNGGTSWTAQTSGTTQALHSIRFSDANTAWAVGSSGTILKTINGGTNWTAQTSGTSQTLEGLHVSSATIAWVTGQGGVIVKTINGGTSWSAQTSGTTQALHGMHFNSTLNGWAVGDAGTIVQTTNGGSTWSAQITGTTVGNGTLSLPLEVGANVITIIVRAANGNATKTYTLTITRAALVDGEVNLAFDPQPNGTLYTAVSQADGKIIIGGTFNELRPQGGAAVARSYLTRLNADGTVDETTFNPAPDRFVKSIIPLTDGRLLVAGEFTTIGGVTRKRVARLNSDGTVDATFVDPDINGEVYCMALQSDGKLLIGAEFGGGFTTVCGVARSYLARLNADGTLDTTFTPPTNTGATGILVQADGKIFVAGSYYGPFNASGRIGVARLNVNGSIDTSFNAQLSSSAVACLAMQADGKLIIGGGFTGFQPRLARLNADGGRDNSFDASVDDDVRTILVQANGKIVIGGDFTTHTSNGVTTARNGLARLNTDGTLDMGFDPLNNSYDLNPTLASPGYAIRHLTAQADGQIIVGGSFILFGGQTVRYSFARLGGEAISQSLNAPSSARLEWLRGGALPEASGVTFQASSDAGITYRHLGEGARISGGWEYLPAVGALPSSGLLRAVARGTGGTDNGSSSLTSATLSFTGFAVPDIAVEQPENTNIADGGSLVFGTVAAGTTSDRVFTIRNTGTVSLTGFEMSIDGFDAAMFSITSAPAATVLPGQSTSFTVRFAPTNGGGHVAALHIASNDFDETPFDITLTDTAAPSANADLLSLTMSSGTFTPTFAMGTTSYAASVSYATTSLTVTPKKRHPGATIKVNGTTVASESSSGTIALSVGDNVINTVVTGADGTTTKIYAITVTRLGPLVGELEVEFDPRAGSPIHFAVPQADGKILVGGQFNALNPNGSGSVTRNYLARLNASGTLDTAFNPNANFWPWCAAVQTDGKILLGGQFGTIGGISRNSLARINADGTLDTTLANPVISDTVYGIAPQPDGKFIIAGQFSTVGGVTRNNIARLNADGTLDTGYNPNFNGPVYCVQLLADGKCLAGGYMSNVSGQSRSYLVRLNTDGTLDTSYNSQATSVVYCIVPQADGKMLVGGGFTSIGGQTRNRIARLNADGSLDSTFNPNAGGDVTTMVLQADGKVILGGAFTTVGGLTRNRIARVNADGTLDASFNPDANNTVKSLALQADGQVIIGGDFTNIAGAARSYLVRLGNDATSQSLTVPSVARVQWLRGAAIPEALGVAFEISTNAGSSYTPLGVGSRIAGGWEYLPAAMPASGQIRALARSAGGNYSSSVGISAAVTSFSGLAVPDIAIEQPASVAIADGGSLAFGAVAVGSTADRSFTIRNEGAASLNVLGITFDGADEEMFSIVTPPASPLLSGQSSSFTVRFAPTNGGGHTAALHLASNDFDETPFDIALSDTPAASANADLIGLSLNNGTLTPTFDKGTTVYTTSVAYGVDSLRVTPTKRHSGASIQVNGTTVASGNASGNLALVVGANVITTLVTAADGTTTKGYYITVTRAAPVAGDVDLGFDPRANGFVNAAVPQADGKILIAGQFGGFTPNGGTTTNRSYLARLNADGTVDTGFTPNANFTVGCIVPQADGKILAGGSFSSIGGATRGNMARLNANGTADTTFGNPAFNNVVNCIQIQTDGKLLVGGSFSTVGGVARQGIARLNADGTLDTTFNALLSANGSVFSMALRSDGKIYLSGTFTSLNSVSRLFFARINADGTLDTTFTPNNGSIVFTMALQADGKLLIGGIFPNLLGQTRNRIARLNADDTLDTGFNPNADNTVQTLAVQADGKIILGGSFTTLQPPGTLAPIPRSRIARLNPDGSLDMSFNPNANSTVRSLALQQDGQILVCGEFSSMGAAARSNLVRLQNDAATQLLSVPSASEVRWLRGGTLPEATRVTFEVSIDGGTTYIPVGSGTRISGGWQYLPPEGSLPANGLLRTQAVSSGGLYNGSSGLTSSVTSFPLLASEIAVEQPVGTSLSAGTASVAFGNVEFGLSSVAKTFTVKNTGFGNLSLSSVTVTGGQASDFTVSTFGMLGVVPFTNGVTSFTVTCTPTAVGTRSTTLRIASNDSDESPFDITLTATALNSSNANLTALTTNAGSVTPAFASTTTAYSITVPNATTTISLTPTKAEPNAVIRVNGSVVASGSASGNIAVSVGSTFINTVVTAQNGSTTKTYALTVTRLPLPPVISTPTVTTITSNSATLGGNVTSDSGGSILARGVVFSPTATDATPTLGESGVSSALHATSSTGVFTIVTTGLIPATAYTYAAYATNSGGTGYTSFGTFTTDGPTPEIVLQQPVSSDVPSGGSRGFGNVTVGSSADLTFTLKNIGTGDLIFSGTPRISLSAGSDFTVLSQPTSPLAGPLGSVTFSVRFSPTSVGAQSTTLTIENNDTNENPFTVQLTGTGLSGNANLSSLTLGTGTLTPSFAANTTSYTVSVPNVTTSLAFTATAAEATATLSGSASPLSLNLGSNTLSVIVTAPDGTTTKTYTVIVSRQTVTQTALSTWAAANSVPLVSADSGDDPDGDGKSNLLEFAFGTIPTSGASGPNELQYSGTLAGNGALVLNGQPITRHEGVATGTDFRALFIRRVDHASVGLIYSVRFSANMITWQTSIVSPTVLATDGIHQVVSVPYPFFIGGKKVRFFQVSVTPAP